MLSLRFIAFFSILIFVACDAPPGPGAAPSVDTDEIRARFDGYTIEELASFVAGKSDRLPDRLAVLARNPAYQQIAARMDSAWESYNTNHLSQLRAWRGELAGAYSPEVFYPFGGPDAVHPLLLFPEARRYTLFGLERFGRLPRLAFDDPAQVARQVDGIHGAVRGVLGRNFFLTLTMTGTVGSGPDNGVGAILLLFLARLDYTILDAYPIALNAAGLIEPIDVAEPAEQAAGPSDPAKNKAQGVRVLFRGADGLVKEINYFQLNISDANLPKTPGLRAYLKQQRDVTTMLKAASYLLYLDAFDDMRGMILNRSRLIVSDSSGMPFHFLDHRGWQLTPYGHYTGPIGLFRIRYEPDRRAYYSKTRGQPLPFAYGYHPTSPNLVVARRAPANEFRELLFDGHDTEGITTFYRNGRQMILGDPGRLAK